MGSAPRPGINIDEQAGPDRAGGALAKVSEGNAAHFCSPGRNLPLGTAFRMSCSTAQNRSSAAHSLLRTVHFSSFLFTPPMGVTRLRLPTSLRTETAYAGKGGWRKGWVSQWVDGSERLLACQRARQGALEEGRASRWVGREFFIYCGSRIPETIAMMFTTEAVASAHRAALRNTAVRLCCSAFARSRAALACLRAIVFDSPFNSAARYLSSIRLTSVELVSTPSSDGCRAESKTV